MIECPSSHASAICWVLLYIFLTTSSPSGTSCIGLLQAAGVVAGLSSSTKTTTEEANLYIALPQGSGRYAIDHALLLQSVATLPAAAAECSRQRRCTCPRTRQAAKEAATFFSGSP